MGENLLKNLSNSKILTHVEINTENEMSYQYTFLILVNFGILGNFNNF